MKTSFTNKSIKFAKRYVHKRINSIAVFSECERDLF